MGSCAAAHLQLLGVHAAAWAVVTLQDDHCVPEAPQLPCRRQTYSTRRRWAWWLELEQRVTVTILYAEEECIAAGGPVMQCGS